MGTRKRLHRTITIDEVPNNLRTDGHWLIGGIGTDGKGYARLESAAAALAYVKEQDRLAAKDHDVVISTIEWRPVTRIGHQIVNAITGRR